MVWVAQEIRRCHCFSVFQSLLVYPSLGTTPLRVKIKVHNSHTASRTGIMALVRVQCGNTVLPAYMNAEQQELLKYVINVWGQKTANALHLTVSCRLYACENTELAVIIVGKKINTGMTCIIQSWMSAPVCVLLIKSERTKDKRAVHSCKVKITG